MPRTVNARRPVGVTRAAWSPTDNPCDDAHCRPTMIESGWPRKPRRSSTTSSGRSPSWYTRTAASLARSTPSTVSSSPLASSGNATLRTRGTASRTPGTPATRSTTCSEKVNPAPALIVSPARPARPSTVSRKDASTPPFMSCTATTRLTPTATATMVSASRPMLAVRCRAASLNDRSDRSRVIGCRRRDARRPHASGRRCREPGARRAPRACGRRTRRRTRCA